MATSLSDHIFDVAVVGAGPAGLAAASSASSHGVDVALLDANPRPGGQYWRQPASEQLAAATAYLHHDLDRFHDLVHGLEAVDWLPGHQVWTVTRHDDAFSVHALTHTGADEREVVVRAQRLVLAPGAYDRQLPFPGWDLPGVMTAGGAQALLKGHGVSAGSRVVVAGTGPFLLPVAAGLAASGAAVLGVYEAASGLGWLRRGGAVVRNARKLAEGGGYVRALVRHRVPVRLRSVVVAAHGDDALESVTVARIRSDGTVVSRSQRTLLADTLAVGWGFTPQLELPLALGCATRTDTDGSTVCVVDEAQRSSVPGVYVAGEACGVGGAQLAVVEGRIAGSAAAGRSAPERTLRRQRSALRDFAAAMHRAHPVPAEWTERLEDSTVLCRCEEVTVGTLREVSKTLGADDARSAKLLARPGMGWCQGRVCGYATSCLIAGWTGAPMSALQVAGRPVAAPVRLSTLAAEVAVADNEGSQGAP